VVFSFLNNRLSILLIKRKFAPGVGRWALPGGFVREEESLDDSARRELQEETGLPDDMYLEQLYTFGRVDRDSRGRVISVAYMVLLAEPERVILNAHDDAADAAWWPIEKLPPLAFGVGHREIIDYACQRLRWKFEYTNAALSMLPRKFTLSDLQVLYEAVYDRNLDKRNFRKKILLLDWLKPVAGQRREFGRPAQLYQARSRKLKYYIKVI
jgi:8-oxo-dGTP diphosphatase